MEKLLPIAVGVARIALQTLSNQVCQELVVEGTWIEKDPPLEDEHVFRNGIVGLHCYKILN